MRGNPMTNLAIIDRLGALQAQIANLEAEEKALKAEIKGFGDGAYEGALFRATVSTADRATLDAKAARAKLEELGASHQWFAANTKVAAVTTNATVMAIAPLSPRKRCPTPATSAASAGAKTMMIAA